MAMATRHRSPRHCCRHQEAPATWTWWGSQYHSSDPRAAAAYFNYRQVSASMSRAGALRKCAALPTPSVDAANVSGEQVSVAVRLRPPQPVDRQCGRVSVISASRCVYVQVAYQCGVAHRWWLANQSHVQPTRRSRKEKRFFFSSVFGPTYVSLPDPINMLC